ncbi:unnamed protein product [marine sediment metagenome]|uniref:Uncharacterized protein n=1 Tax=marine sediment metagenome TaxID=412755 RepID=X0SMS6_9ZZZZ
MKKVVAERRRKRKLRHRLKRASKTTDPAAASASVDIQAFLGETSALSLLDNASDFRKVIEKVLKDDFTDTVEIDGKKLQLKVLKAGPAKRISQAISDESTSLMSLMTTMDKASTTSYSVISMCIDGLSKAAAILLPFYGMDQYNGPKVIMDSLEASEIQDLCYAQLRVQERADFLLDPLRPICGITRIGLMMTKQMTERLTTPTDDTENSPETTDSA